MEYDPQKVFGVIIAGGAGTRLWPLSRKSSPKPFLPGRDGRSFLQATLARAQRLSPKTLTIVARSLVPKVQQELPSLPAHDIIGEPAARNTAAAIGLAAMVAFTREPEALLAILPADHVIADEDAFQKAAMAALELAAKGEVVTLGITPTRPETGYGYLWLGEPVGQDAFRVRRFIEKPTLSKAEEYLSSGDFLWNSGTFFFSAKALLSAIDAHMPALGEGLRRISQDEREVGLERALDMHFASLPSNSIDFGVMEHLQEIACVRAHCGWDDVGTLASYAHVTQTRTPIEVSAQNNVAIGVSKKVIAVVGCDDLLIVESEDALVICKRQESQKIREVVAAVEADHH